MDQISIKEITCQIKDTLKEMFVRCKKQYDTPITEKNGEEFETKTVAEFLRVIREINILIIEAKDYIPPKRTETEFVEEHFISSFDFYNLKKGYMFSLTINQMKTLFVLIALKCGVPQFIATRQFAENLIEQCDFIEIIN
jgi:hypothetical protein